MLLLSSPLRLVVCVGVQFYRRRHHRHLRRHRRLTRGGCCCQCDCHVNRFVGAYFGAVNAVFKQIGGLIGRFF